MVNVDPKMNPNYESDEEDIVYRRPGGLTETLSPLYSILLNFTSSTYINAESLSRSRDSYFSTKRRESTHSLNGSTVPISSGYSENNGAAAKSQQKENPLFSPKPSMDLGLTSAGASKSPLMPTIDENEKIWYYKDPSSKIQGPFSMTQLRKWNTTGYFPSSLRIWKTSDKEDEAILLTDALLGKFQKSTLPPKMPSTLDGGRNELTSQTQDSFLGKQYQLSGQGGASPSQVNAWGGNPRAAIINTHSSGDFLSPTPKSEQVKFDVDSKRKSFEAHQKYNFMSAPYEDLPGSGVGQNNRQNPDQARSSTVEQRSELSMPSPTPTVEPSRYDPGSGLFTHHTLSLPLSSLCLSLSLHSGSPFIRPSLPLSHVPSLLPSLSPSLAPLPPSISLCPPVLSLSLFVAPSVICPPLSLHLSPPTPSFYLSLPPLLFPLPPSTCLPPLLFSLPSPSLLRLPPSRVPLPPSTCLPPSLVLPPFSISLSLVPPPSFHLSHSHSHSFTISLSQKIYPRAPLSLSLSPHLSCFPRIISLVISLSLSHPSLLLFCHHAVVLLPPLSPPLSPGWTDNSFLFYFSHCPGKQTEQAVVQDTTVNVVMGSGPASMAAGLPGHGGAAWGALMQGNSAGVWVTQPNPAASISWAPPPPLPPPPPPPAASTNVNNLLWMAQAQAHAQAQAQAQAYPGWPTPVPGGLNLNAAWYPAAPTNLQQVPNWGLPPQPAPPNPNPGWALPSTESGSSAGGSGGSQAPPPNAGICMFYERGHCKKGDSCNYMHYR